MDGTFEISRSTLIEIDGAGQLIASVSETSLPIDLTQLAVLRCFAKPATVTEAFQNLPPDARITAEVFAKAAEALAGSHFLVKADGTKTAVRSSYGSLELHHWMLRDFPRVMAYRTAIGNYVKDKVVVEIGCGTGILSIFAALAGAKKVYAIEESSISTLAAEMFAANGVADRVELVRGMSWDVKLPEPADVLIQELFGPYGENMIRAVRGAKQTLLKPGAKCLPERVDVCCVGVESPFAPQLRERLALEAAELDKMYGLKFAPFTKTLVQMFDLEPVGSMVPGLRDTSLGQGFFKPKILTKEVLLRTIDFTGPLDRTTEKRIVVDMPITSNGRIGALLVFFRAHFDDTFSLSTSPFRPWTHWGWPLRELSRAIEGQAGKSVKLASHVMQLGPKDVFVVDLA